MSLYKEACSLIHHSASSIPMHMRDKLKDPKFLEVCQEVDWNNDEKCKLTIKLLDKIALDPLKVYEGKDVCGMMWFANRTGYILNLHRTINPIGMLSLGNSNPALIEALNAAIEKNLNSKMYKAAQTSRRIDKLVSKGLNRIYEKGNQLRQSLIAELKKTTGRGYLATAQVDQINRKVSSFEEPMKEHLYKRFRAVEKVATPGVEQGYYTWLATFLYDNISINQYQKVEEFNLV